RARLYRALARFEENHYQANPVVIEYGTVNEWFRGCGLSQQLLETIKAHTYRNEAGVLLFSDVPQALAKIEDREEERRFMRALTRTRSLMVRTKPPENGFAEWENYWSAQGKNRDILPLIQSVGRSPNADKLDVVHLLPSIARRNLNTFPSERDGLSGRFPDDFWTAINFFSFKPKSLYHDSFESGAFFNQRFNPSTGDLQYGDVVLISRLTDGQTIHACVFIADGVVFTKHGPSRLSPWVLTRLNTLIARHGGKSIVNATGWRVAR
ncbi:MAG: hypothetical protein AAF585_04550, partial [Verrucomicrobiota bacterium]